MVFKQQSEELGIGEGGTALRVAEADDGEVLGGDDVDALST